MYIKTINCVFYTKARPEQQVINELCLVRVPSDCTLLRTGEEHKHLAQFPALDDGTLRPARCVPGFEG